MLFETSLLPDLFERCYTEVPDQKIWEWADENVWLEPKDAAEPGFYRSAKTPWTRRFQELWQNPTMMVWDWEANAYVSVKVKELASMKSSQSGLTEAVLNGIRHDSKFSPRNCIYTVDTRETAGDISDRLEPSLRRLDDSDIFTGDDNDVGTFTMRLLLMSIWFQGSFSTGKFASKMAPRVVSDESEEQGSDSTDTSNDTALKSRKKTANNGLFVTLCKPKRAKGPIHKAYLRGNQEEFFVTCPHCKYLQPLTFFRNEDLKEPKLTPFSEKLIEIKDEQTGRLIAVLPIPLKQGETRKLVTGRMVFEHCRDKLGKWDELKILRETYYECGSCQGRIDEKDHKDKMVANATWLPTAIGTPGVVSQHINDLYSSDENSSWGQIVLEFLRCKREGRKELQGFYNHVLGIPWSDEISKTSEADLLSNIAGREIFRIDAPAEDGKMARQIFERKEAAEAAAATLRARGYECDIVPSFCPPYRKGEIPFVPVGMLLGSDVGGNYAKWAIGAVMANWEDVAIIDWGEELEPKSIAEIINTHRWKCTADEKSYAIGAGFIDGKFRKGDVLNACVNTVGRRLVPCAGLGGSAARTIKLFAEAAIPGFPGFKRLDFNDREAKDEYYILRIKRKHRRVFFPVDIEEHREFISENCAEELIEDENGRTIYNPHPEPNHYGDCVKAVINGLRYMTRRAASLPQRPKANG